MRVVIKIVDDYFFEKKGEKMEQKENVHTDNINGMPTFNQ